VADLHATQSRVVLSNHVMNNDMPQPCEECKIVGDKYVLYIPSDASANPDNKLLDHSPSHYIRQLAANQSPKFKRIFQIDQSRSSPKSYGYHDSDGTTDSAETPSTVPIRHQIVNNSSPSWLRQSRSHRLHRSVPREVRHLLESTATTSQSTSPPSMSGPRWDLQRYILPNDMPTDSTTDDVAQSTPTTSPMLTPASSRKYSDNIIISPRPGAYANTNELLAAARQLSVESDLVWTPQSSRWGTSLALSYDNMPSSPDKPSAGHYFDI
jgi:hypothetical protein